MKSVRAITEEIIAREGGYVNDPDDPGGATKYGVTIGTLRRLGLDLDRDGRVTAADVQRLTRAQAADIFVEHYFVRTRVAELPEVLQSTVYDMYVNAGANAVKLLQRMLRDMRIEVAVDGVIGPQTIGAAKKAVAAAPTRIADATGSRGATITMRWRTGGRRAASSRAAGMAAREGGSYARKSSSRPPFT